MQPPLPRRLLLSDPHEEAPDEQSRSLPGPRLRLRWRGSGRDGRGRAGSGRRPCKNRAWDRSGFGRDGGEGPKRDTDGGARHLILRLDRTYGMEPAGIGVDPQSPVDRRAGPMPLEPRMIPGAGLERIGMVEPGTGFPMTVQHANPPENPMPSEFTRPRVLARAMTLPIFIA